jgi:hypothetical protein
MTERSLTIADAPNAILCNLEQPPTAAIVIAASLKIVAGSGSAVRPSPFRDNG